MPIVINTSDVPYGRWMTDSSIAIWLQQSLTRFTSNNKGRICTSSQFEDTHDPYNSLSNTAVSREGNWAVIVSTSQSVSRSAHEKMRKKLEHIRLKWGMISRMGKYESPDLIMLNAQCNLIGLSTTVCLDEHSNDRSMIRANIADKSTILALQKLKDLFQEISDRTANIIYGDTFPKAGTNQAMNVPHMEKSLDLMHTIPCDYQETFRKKNYRYTDIFHCFQLDKDSAGNPSFHHTLYAHCGAIADISCNLQVAFRHYLESVAHCWKQFAMFIEYTSFRHRDVIYLLSRTTMRRVKFLYEKPPTTLTV